MSETPTNQTPDVDVFWQYDKVRPYVCNSKGCHYEGDAQCVNCGSGPKAGLEQPENPEWITREMAGLHLTGVPKLIRDTLPTAEVGKVQRGCSAACGCPECEVLDDLRAFIAEQMPNLREWKMPFTDMPVWLWLTVSLAVDALLAVLLLLAWRA